MKHKTAAELGLTEEELVEQTKLSEEIIAELITEEGEPMTKYNLIIDQKQADVIITALDFFSRVLCGQLEEIRWVLLKNAGPNSADYEAVEVALDVLKREFFDLQGASHMGIYNSPERAKVAYDLVQVIRHRVSWDETPSGGITVNFDEPLKVSQGTELAIIEKAEEE